MDFLASINHYAKNEDIEVILVDNAPIENHEKRFKAKYPSLVYIHSIKNTGFAGGNNLGIRQSKGMYILLLNNDTEITENFISSMRKEMDTNKQIGLLSPLIKYFNHKDIIQYAGFTKMNYLTGRNSAIGYLEKEKGQYKNDSRETAFSHGAAMMCRKEDLLKAGYMDERYFLYYEELDWCEKFKRLGKKIWFTGNAIIYHKESMSVGMHSPLKIFFMTRNRFLYIRRNTTLLNTIIFGLYYTLFVCPSQIIKYTLQSQHELANAVKAGLKWNFTHTKESNEQGYPIS